MGPNILRNLVNVSYYGWRLNSTGFNGQLERHDEIRGGGMMKQEEDA